MGAHGPQEGAQARRRQPREREPLWGRGSRQEPGALRASSASQSLRVSITDGAWRGLPEGPWARVWSCRCQDLVHSDPRGPGPSRGVPSRTGSSCEETGSQDGTHVAPAPAAAAPSPSPWAGLGAGGPLGTRSHRCDPTRGPGLPEEAPPHLLRPGGLGAPLWARTSGRFTALAQWLNATLSPGMGGAAEGQSSGPRKGPLLSRACCPQVGSWDGQQSAPDLPVVVATPPSSPCPVMPSAVQLPLSLDLAHGSQRVSSPRARGPGPEAPQPPIWSGDRVGGPKPPPSHTEGALRGPYD